MASFNIFTAKMLKEYSLADRIVVETEKKNGYFQNYHLFYAVQVAHQAVRRMSLASLNALTVNIQSYLKLLAYKCF